MKGRLRSIDIPENIWEKFVLQWDEIEKMGSDEVLKYLSNKGMSQPLITEIGCGTGDFLLKLSEYYSDFSIIGIDHAYTVIQRAVKKMSEKEIKNVVLINFDASKLVEKTGEKIKFNKIFITFPDPWPKKKHHKRRLIQTQYLEELYNILDENGELIIISDHPDYQKWIYNKLVDFNKFKPILKDRIYTDDMEEYKSMYPFTESTFYKKSLVKGHTTNFYLLRK